MKKLILFLTLTLFTASLVFATTVTIGTGTSTDRYPLGDYYVYQRSQMLFTSSEIGLTGDITHVRWYRNDVGADPNAVDVEIWLKETTDTVISTSTWETPGTLVYSGTAIDLGSGDEWYEIDITDFAYGGGSNNLLVSTYCQNAPYTAPHSYWRYTSTSPNYMMRRGQSDSTNPPSLSTSYYRPNIQFEIPTTMPDDPATFTAVAASAYDIDLDWTQNGNSDNVLVAWSSDGTFGTPIDGTTYSAGNPITGGGTVLYYGSDLHYDHLSLTPMTQYFYKAWSYDTSEYSLGITDDATTFCVPYTAPFSENFDSVTPPALPDCWSKLIVGASTYAYVETSTTGSNSAPNNVRMYNSSLIGADDYLLLITPQLSDLTSQSNRIRFMGRASGYAQDLIVGTMSDPTDETTFTAFQTIPLSIDTYTEYTVLFDASYTLTDEYIAFRDGADVTYRYLNIDDFVYEPIPSCLNPSDLVVTNVTTTSADLGWTEINTPTPATLWDIEWGTTGFAQGSGTMITGTLTNPHSLSGLTAGTGYSWYVRADCGSRETSPWSGPSSFATLVTNDSCAVAIAVGEVTDLAWNTSSATTSGFDTHSINQDIWYVYTPSANGLATFDLCGSTFDTKLAVYGECDVLTELGYNDDSAYCDPDARAVQSAILDLPVVYGEDYMIQVGGYGSNSGAGDLTITLITCPAPTAQTTTAIGPTQADLGWTLGLGETSWDIEIDTTGFTPTGTPTYSGVTNPYTVTGLLSDTSYQWYVRADCGGSDYSTWTGPVSFTTLVSCPAPSAQTSTGITSNSADLGWTLGYAETSWDIEIDTTNFIPTGTPTYTGVTNPYTVTGLNASTSYEWYVRADCGGSDYSVWVGPVSFLTLDSCPFPTAQTTTTIGPDQADLGWTEMGTAVLWDIEIDTLGATFTGAPDSSGVTNPYTVTGLLNETSYEWYVRADCGTDAVSAWVGPASFTTLVQCPAPTSPITTNILQTSANLDWTDGWAESNWYVEWDTTGFALGTGDLLTLTSHPHGLTTLTANTSYDWYVQADCDGPITPGGESVWVGPITFTTLCDAVTTYPWTENFDAAQVTPDCWTNNSTEEWEFSTSCSYGANADHTTGYENFAWLDDSTPYSNPSNLDTPVLDVTGLTTPRLQFYYWIGEATTGSYLCVDVFDGTSWTDSVGYYTPNNEWDLATIDLSSYSSTTTQVRFRAMENLSGYNCDLCIDDILVEETPSCPAPTGLFTSNITDSTAVMNWTAGGIEPNWNIEWGVAGFVQGTGTMILNTTNPDTLTGLTAAMLYDWYVQADCDGGATRDESAWVGPITFGTTGAGTCDHYVVLIDSYGDGWNGGTLDIYRNGNLAISGLTIISGAGPDTTGVTANQADSLFFDYTAGSWAYENEYYVYRVYDNALVISQGAGDVEPIDTYIADCCPPPTLAIDPSPYDFGNIPYNKVPTQVFTLTNIGDGTVTVNSASDITLTGDTEFTILSIYANNGYPVSLPSDSLIVEVQFAPSAAVSYSTVLSVVWTGAIRSTTDATITGTGCTPLPNDDCVNATAVSGPYPATGSGSNECAFIDCPGLLDWLTIWYEIDLPYECQDVEITICAADTNTVLASVGIILMDDCACDDYIVRQDGLGAGWITCPSGAQGYNMIFPSITGYSIMLWPSYLVDADGGVAFTYEIDVTPCETPNAPQDVSVTVAGSNVTVSWTYHSELTYTVYSDTDPYGAFTNVEGSGIAADHLDITPIPGVPTFYRVTCDNPPVRTRTYSDGIGITERAPKVIAPNRERK